MRRVVVKSMWRGEVQHQFPEQGVFFDDKGLVINVDPYGAIDIYRATPIKGTDVVIVAENAERLNDDNTEDLVIDLILGGAKQ